MMVLGVFYVFNLKFEGRNVLRKILSTLYKFVADERMAKTIIFKEDCINVLIVNRSLYEAFLCSFCS